MKNDSLFVLIKSLNKNEKGYFKKNSRLYSTTKENHYLALFDVIDKMDTYNEKELKLELKGEKWIKNLPSLKSYLFLQILKNLEAYQNSGGKNEDPILAQTDILIHRGLYAEALVMLKKGQALAEANENFYQVLHSLDREKLILGALSPDTDIKDKIMKVKSRRESVLQAIRENYDITDLNDEVYRIYEASGTLRIDEKLRQLDTLIGPDRIRWIENISSRKGRMAGYNMLTAYFFLKQDIESSFNYAKKLFDLTEKTHEYFDRRMIKVYMITFNFLQLCISSGNFKVFDKNIKSMENLKPQFGFSLAKKFFMLHFLYFTYLRTIPRPADIHLYLPRFRRELKLYEASLSSMDVMGLCIHVSHLLFLNGDTNEAIDWNNYALRLEKEVDREDYRAGARIQDLIFHYEVGSYRLLDSKLLSAQRYLRKKNIFYKTEQCIISHLRQLPKAKTKMEQLEIFQKFKHNYADIIGHSDGEKTFGDYFKLPEWIDAKIKKLST